MPSAGVRCAAPKERKVEEITPRLSQAVVDISVIEKMANALNHGKISQRDAREKGVVNDAPKNQRSIIRRGGR